MLQENDKQGMTEEKLETFNEENFLKELYIYMKNRDTPIERIPHLGFKQIDLFLMYKAVQKLGGYNQVTAHQLWKQVYNELGGNPRSTSAATCTRRHYEKLILPFERHLRGEDDKDLPPPQLKRPRQHSFLSEEEEGQRGGKRSNYRYNHASLPRDAHTFLPNERIRIIPVPVHFRQYFHQSHLPMPACNSFPSSPQPTQVRRYSQVPHQRTSQDSSDWPRQQLNLLRTLAKEYTSSSGFGEPLDLSSKGGLLGLQKDQPSSFTPTSCNNKGPKFLNSVSPLYTKYKEGSEVVENYKQSKDDNPTASVDSSPTSTQDQCILDLTSTSSHNTFAVKPLAIQQKQFSSSPLSIGPPSVSEAKCDKTEKETIQQKEMREAPKPRVVPLDLIHPSTTRTGHSAGNMEIQIPLALLQDLLKGNLALRHQSVVDSPPASKEVPVKQAYNGNVDRRSPSEKNCDERRSPRGYGNIASPTLKERSMRSLHYQDVVNSYQVSLGLHGKDWQYASKSRENSKLPEVTRNSPLSSEGYFYPKDRKSPKLLHMPIPNLTMSSRSQVQSSTAPLWSYQVEKVKVPSSAPLSHGPALHKQVQRVTLPEKQIITDPSKVVMVNPASSAFPPLTLEEFHKLKRLISTSE